jgi:putative 4-mercaptohistidine N1-methyltranferase
MNLYETQRLVDEYLLFHYGQDREILPWENGPVSALGFPVRTVTELQPANAEATAKRALDIGCATGRSSFELSKMFREVIGIDYSHAFIQAAQTLQSSGQLPYQITREGLLTEPLTARLPDNIHPDRVTFQQGDAMNLPDTLGTFDLVHAANLVCRLTEPLRFLSRLPSLMNPGGHLLLTTPCTWLAEFTPPDRWPTGSTFDWLKEILSPDFTLVLQKDLPFLIREHARKFQWSVALGTVWQRR